MSALFKINCKLANIILYHQLCRSFTSFHLVFEYQCCFYVHCSVSRLYWSTVDPRRRSVYTCRILEVVPKVVKSSLPVVIEDMTIAHDVNDPDYDPVKAAAYCSRIRHKSADEDTVSVSEDECLSDAGSGEESADSPLSDTGRSKSDCVQTNEFSYQSFGSLPSHLRASTVRPAFSQLAGMQFDHSLPTGVLRSWKEQNMKSSPSLNDSGISNTSRKVTTAVDDNYCSISGLSPDTLKLLGISSPSNRVAKRGQSAAVIAEPLTVGGDDLLLSMACRLNEAAARSSRVKARLRTAGVTKPKTGTEDGDQQAASDILLTSIDKEGCEPSRTAAHESDTCSVGLSYAVTSRSNGCVDESNCDVLSSVAIYSSSKSPARAALTDKLSGGLTSIMQTDGPPFTAESDQEGNEELHLVADFSTDDEQSSLSSDESNEEQLRNKLVSPSLREGAEMSIATAFGMKEKSVYDSSDKVQEKPQVVLHDILKTGISIQDGVCRLNTGQEKALSSCVLMRKSPTGHAGKADEGKNSTAMSYGNSSSSVSTALMDKITSLPAEKSVVASHQPAFSVFKHSCETDVDKLISDVISGSSTTASCDIKSRHSDAVKMDSSVCMKGNVIVSLSSSGHSSFTGPKISTTVIKTISQKVNCIRIPSVSTAGGGSIVRDRNATALRSPVSKDRPSIMSQLMTEPRVTSVHSSMSSEPLVRPGVRLASLPRERCQTLADGVSAQSVMSVGNQPVVKSFQNVSAPNLRMVTQKSPAPFVDTSSGDGFSHGTEPVAMDSDHGTFSYVGQVPLNGAALQASVRPVRSSFINALATGTSHRELDVNLSGSGSSAETLEHLLANAKERPYFIRVSADDAANERNNSAGCQGRLPARPLDDELPTDAIHSTNDTEEMTWHARKRSNVCFAEDAVVANKNKPVNLDHCGNNESDKCGSNLTKTRVMTSDVLMDASNQLLSPPKRRLRVKLKDRSSLNSGLGLLDFLFWYLLVFASEVVTGDGRICVGG
jgi:hypothetical protein